MPLQRNNERRTSGKKEASRRTGSSGISRTPGHSIVVCPTIPLSPSPAHSHSPSSLSLFRPRSGLTKEHTYTHTQSSLPFSYHQNQSVPAFFLFFSWWRFFRARKTRNNVVERIKRTKTREWFFFFSSHIISLEAVAVLVGVMKRKAELLLRLNFSTFVSLEAGRMDRALSWKRGGIPIYAPSLLSLPSLHSAHLILPPNTHTQQHNNQGYLQRQELPRA